MEIHEVQERTDCLVKELLSVWESSVRATHRFLDEPEILGIREYVPHALACVEHLVVAEDEGGAPIAFMGVQDGCLEMLFVHDGWRGRGIGSGLLEKARVVRILSSTCAFDVTPVFLDTRPSYRRPFSCRITAVESYLGEKHMRLVFLGPPGAGKGTIAAKAKDVYGIPHISTGDLFRENIKNETGLGVRVKSILAAGDLVPDEVTIAMVDQRLKEDDANGGFILDGFPRTIAQADALASMTDLDRVVNFVLDKEAIVRRLSGRRVCKSTGRTYHILYNPPKVEGIDDETGEPLIQRDDDKEEAIRNRLEVYEASTAPLIAYYRDRGLLVDIDASLSPDEVLKAMVDALK